VDSHIRLLAVLRIIYSALGLALGLIGLLFFGGLGAVVGMTNGDPDALVAVPILGAIGVIAFLFFAVLSVPGLIAGYGLLKYRPWARILTIVLSVLDLLNFPLGTALGVYGFWVLFSPQVVGVFERDRVRYS
jgi:hypothetical protein